MGNNVAYGYVIGQINVTDNATYPTYVAMVQPIVKKFGGVFLVRGGNIEVPEGQAPGERIVVIRFPSLQAAHDWYHSDDYADAKALRMSASESVQIIVEGT